MPETNASRYRFLRVFLACLFLGLFGGAIGAVFSLGITYVTSVRINNGWLIYLLPLCGLFIAFLYKNTGVTGIGTNNVILACRKDEKLSPALAFSVFISSVFSHLCGASVGREGAALQIGGSVSASIAKLFALNEAEKQILIRAGMAALFSAVFGTPLTAFFFALEVVSVGVLHLKSAIPCLVSSFLGFFVSLSLGMHPEQFDLTDIPSFSFAVCWKVAVITVLTALMGIVFCLSLRLSSNFAKKFFANTFLRTFVGGVLIVILTLLIKTRDYNGAGINIMEHIFKSAEFRPEAFALKLLFTCVSVAFGYKGGEIVPTLFVGATFGALLASFLGLPVAFGCALGMVLHFCSVTNCPLASLFLGLELFSGMGAVYFLPCVAVCFIISGKVSLYTTQEHRLKLIRKVKR